MLAPVPVDLEGLVVEDSIVVAEHEAGRLVEVDKLAGVVDSWDVMAANILEAAVRQAAGARMLLQVWDYQELPSHLQTAGEV